MTENHPIHISTVNKGCNTDTDPEIVLSVPSAGVYLDGHNTRPVSIDNNTGANEKIKGEILTYPNTTGLTNYSCVGSITVINNLVEIWGDNAGSGPGIIIVNGQVVLKSVNFLVDVNFPHQMDRNESPLNPEIFDTDNKIPPSIFNVQDMIDSVTSDPNKYFSAFDPLIYQINLQSPLDRPTFIELVNVGGGGGRPVGQYSYAMRYSSTEGDRTNWSVDSPLIPIMEGLSSDSLIYPWSKTYGGPPAPSSPTSFVPRIRFRVTNIYNYDFIEIGVTAYNIGAGINYVPQRTVVAKIAIDKGEISVRDYIDPADSNTNLIVSEDDSTQELAEIQSAKSIHYFSRRTVLMNVNIASKESDLQFLQINGKEGFPYIEKLYTSGHKDPWNHTNRRQYMGGEKYGFGIVGFDGVGSSGFVEKSDQLKNFQYPNRRDVVSTETYEYSLNGTVRAATTQVATVDQTHEVFDLTNAQAKADVCDFKNIHRSGSFLGLTGTRTTSKVKEDCNEDDGEIENHGANVSGINVSVSYQPFTPTRQNDNDVSGHNYITDTKVFSDATEVGCISSDDHTFNYRPAGFGPNYYAHGMMIAGVTNFPKWMKAFSVVRTDAAARVVCQGLGYYSLTKAQYNILSNATLGGKIQNKVWFYSPDIEQGVVSSNTVNDIIDNPQNYSIQMVSPLGFFSEVYGFENAETNCDRDRLIDMISYVRMIRDNISPSIINPNEDPAMGTTSDGHNYVDYDKYRNTTQNPNIFGGDANKGNKIFSIASVTRKVEGRGQFIEIETNGDIYGAPLTGGSTDRQFDDSGMKNFTEPMYIINIVRTGANIPDTDVQKYKATDHYQKIESIIGQGNGLPNQIYPLVDERYDDCIPTPINGQFGSTTDRFIYIKNQNGTYKKWINVTYKSIATTSAIIASITGTGVYNTDIYGVYTHTNVGGLSRQFEINFPYTGFNPQAGELIIVRYDDTAPIRVFGGDTFIGETIFAPIDGQADANADAAETQFPLGIGLPYFKWKLNPRYYTIRKSTASVNLIQDSVELQLGYIRQLSVMFCVESRVAVHLAHNLQSPNQFFPSINYVIRANRWDDTKDTINNGIFQAYIDDYGEQEIGQWKYGGFRFLQQINPDYSCEPAKKYFSKPAFGFVEKTSFPTRVMWSLPRAINIQNSPGLRTFPVNNNFDIDDNFGEIKFAYDDTTANGENLYAITKSGICMLITKKSILTDLNAGEIGYMSADGFVTAQYWRNKEIGMTDEMWRSAVVTFVPVGEGAEQTRVKALFFANTRSIFRFMNNEVMDIWGNYNKVYNEGLAFLTPGFTTKVVGAYNTFYQEYWLYLKNDDVDTCFVYGQSNGMWFGTNDFKFDKITSTATVVYGSRNLESYTLNEGYQINGAPIESRLVGGASPEQNLGKEFIAIHINTLQGQKPTQVNFYKEFEGVIQCSLSLADQGTRYVKDYNGYESQIPRISASVDPSRPRIQQRLIIWEIIHNLESAFKVVNVFTQYKTLKVK